MNIYERWLLDWFSKRVSHLTLNINENYFTVGATDSLGVIELIEDMEQTFNVRFSQDDFLDKRFVTISGLAELLKNKKEL